MANPFSGIITSDLKTTHTQMITALLFDDACTVQCELSYEGSKNEDCPNCFTSETMIKTRTGYKKIKNVQLGELVYDGQEYNKVTHLFSRLYTGCLYNIQASGLRLNNYVTGNHKFPIIRNFKKNFTKEQWADKNYVTDANTEEVEAENIRIGDAIVLPDYNDNVEELSFIETELGCIECTDEILWMLGLWLAEGCVHKSKYPRESAFCLCQSKEEDMAKRVGSVIQESFNVIPKYEYRTNADNLLVNVYSAKLARFFIQFGQGAANKHIPENLWEFLSLEQKSKLLEGIVDGDGHISKTGLMIVGTISQQLSFQIYDIAHRLGLFPGIRYKPEYIDKAGQFHNQSWYVCWQKNRKIQKNNVRAIPNGYAAIVDKINTKHDTVGVYNLEVENSHKYIADNMLVNNCVQNILMGNSASTYQPGGPIPFSFGECPFCNGRGRIETPQLETIYVMPIWDSKQWIGTEANVNAPNVALQTMTLIENYTRIETASTIRMDTAISGYGTQKFQRQGDSEPCGFGSSAFIITNWSKVS